MRKFKVIAVLVTSVLATSVLGTSVVSAEEKLSTNEQLSGVRQQISLQMLENKLKDVQLKNLEKDKEIKKVEDELNGSSMGTSSTIIAPKEEKDLSYQFDNVVNQEDILSEANGWDQNAGFIYKSDLEFESNDLNSPISGLTNNETEEELDFEAMLQKVSEEASRNIEEDDQNAEMVNSTAPVADVNEFKLVGLELSELTIHDGEKEAGIKVNYFKNNGYQKIKGAKTVIAKEGTKFNVEGKASFEVISIDSYGVKVKNTMNDTIQTLTR